MIAIARWPDKPGTGSPTLMKAKGHSTDGLMSTSLISPRSMVQIHLAPQTIIDGCLC